MKIEDKQIYDPEKTPVNGKAMFRFYSSTSIVRIKGRYIVRKGLKAIKV